jgi:hypothetical protein
MLTHSSLQVLQFLAWRGICDKDQTLHSTDLAPAEFWMFWKLKCAERKVLLGQ